jgi:SRSO17 transposase
MLARAFAAQVPAAWVVGDTIYGGDELRRWLEGQGRPYVLAVPSTHGLWTAGQQVEAQALVAGLPDAAWARLSAGEGSQGPRWYDWALLALPYDAPPGMAHWLLARRGIGDPTEHAYYRVCGPAETPLAALVQVAGRRWCIETAFEEAKGLVGLDEYEVRKWAAWHRHPAQRAPALTLLAHAALVVTRERAAEAEKGAAAVSH